MLWQRDRLFCEMNPFFYAISQRKEIVKRNLKDLLSGDRFSRAKSSQTLPSVVWTHSSLLIKKGKGIDLSLQEGKAVNIGLASAEINGLVIRPGEVFSFWRTVGDSNERRGYQAGRVLRGDALRPGVGGGLCNLAHTIDLLVLHSPLAITELHLHSDALAPDQGQRTPFATGTSVSYNYLDFRFRNNTDQAVQLLTWCDDERSYGELRSEREFPWRYDLVEQDHHFVNEGGKYYSISQVLRRTIDRATGDEIERTLVARNHSEVLYDYDAIPRHLVRE